MPTTNSILDEAAVWMGDALKTEWTNAVLLPFLNGAYEELQMEMQLNNFHILREASANVTLNIGDTTIDFPADYASVIELAEKAQNDLNFGPPMKEKMWEPDRSPQECLYNWVVRTDGFKFVGATTVRIVRIRYLKYLPALILGSMVSVPNSKRFLSFKTAYLAAALDQEKQTRAKFCEAEALKALQVMMDLNAKMKQATPIRMLPATRELERR